MMRSALQSLSDFFVPSDRNGQLPYVLTRAAASVYLVVALVLLLAPSYLRVTELASLTLPFSFTKEQMVSLTNDARRSAGLAPLTVNSTLEQAAAAKAENMFAEQYFAHVSPTGKTAWSFIKGAGYQYLAAGENLAEDFSQATDAQAAFMNSPSHRENILNPLYTEVGIVVAQGTLNGRASIVVVEYFGKPKPTNTVTGGTTSPRPTPQPRPTPRPTPRPIATTPATTTPRVSTTVVSNLNLVPAVLGTSESQSRLDSVKEKVMVIKTSIPDYVKIKIVAIIVEFSLLLALAFLIKRTHHFPLAVAWRTLVLLLCLGYAATYGVRDWHAASVTPISASTVVDIQ